MIRTHTVTCISVPTQIEGQLSNDYYFYARSRFGKVQIAFTKNEDKAATVSMTDPDHLEPGEYNCYANFGNSERGAISLHRYRHGLDCVGVGELLQLVNAFANCVDFL